MHVTKKEDDNEGNDGDDEDDEEDVGVDDVRWALPVFWRNEGEVSFADELRKRLGEKNEVENKGLWLQSDSERGEILFTRHPSPQILTF